MAVWVLRLGKSGGRIDAESCGYQTWKQQSRAERTEWEHLSRANHQYHSQLIHGQLYSLWNETMSASSCTTLPYSQNYRAERSKDRTPAKPHAQPEDKVPKLEAELAKLRKTKREVKSKIEAGQIFERRAGGFQSEASEHIDRLLHPAEDGGFGSTSPRVTQLGFSAMLTWPAFSGRPGSQHALASEKAAHRRSPDST